MPCHVAQHRLLAPVSRPSQTGDRSAFTTPPLRPFRLFQTSQPPAVTTVTPLADVTTPPLRLLRLPQTDDLYNYAGFRAEYTSALEYCGHVTDCGTCGNMSLCNWCRSSHQCLPTRGSTVSCASEAWVDSPGASIHSCCPTGWAGANCDACAPNHFGPSCTPCPCNELGGTCDDGLTGSGACTCFHDVTRGFTGAECRQCRQDYWGAACEACSCSGSSTCDDGASGVGERRLPLSPPPLASFLPHPVPAPSLLALSSPPSTAPLKPLP